MKRVRSKSGIFNNVVFALLISFLLTGCNLHTSTDNNSLVLETSNYENEKRSNLEIESVSDKAYADESAKIKEIGNSNKIVAKNEVLLSDIPKYSGKSYVVINSNKPSFKTKEIRKKSFESYSSLDSLGRCGSVIASVGKDIMPTDKRGAIGQIKPTGWHTIKYDFVDGKYLYNRCHLIGYQLTGENANEKNLITGTRYMNVEGMLPFEDMVADYVKETNNHVMYRVIPVYKGNNLLASGVEMEAYSVEDSGEGISFHVFCYNVQPNVTINYATGDSNAGGKVADNETKKETQTNKQINNSKEYVLNMNTHKFHLPSCSSVKQMSNSNKGTYSGSREDLIKQGYDPCKRCNP